MHMEENQIIISETDWNLSYTFHPREQQKPVPWLRVSFTKGQTNLWEKPQGPLKVFP